MKIKTFILNAAFLSLNIALYPTIGCFANTLQTIKSTVNNTQLNITDNNIKKILKLEYEYIKSKIKNNFKNLYSIQTPYFKKIISYEIFVANEGRARLDYSNLTGDKKIPKVDIYSQKLLIKLINGKIKKLLLDTNGKYAKFETLIRKKIMLGMPTSILVNEINYWKLIDGNWHILSHKRAYDFFHISGNITKIDWIDLPEEKCHYKEVHIPKSLKMWTN